MSQKTPTSFWIPGGVLLLVSCILLAPLHGYAVSHFRSDIAQIVITATTWFLRAVAVAGVLCIIIGLVRRRRGEHL